MPAPLPTAKRRKKNPLPTLLALAVLLGLSAFIVFGNLNKSLEYYDTPTEYSQRAVQPKGREMRLGGLVKGVKYDPQTLKLSFIITDGGASFPVKYTGAVSDLFKENQGVVVRGKFDSNTFMASELVVKHSEEYKAPKTQADLKDMLKKNK